MAFGAMGGLAQGLAQGLQLGWAQQERERQAERQDRLDARDEKRFSWEEEKQDKERRSSKLISDTVNAGAQTEGFASESTSGKYFNKNEDEAKQLADLNAAADEMAAGPAGDQGAAQPAGGSVQKAVAVSDFGGKSKLFAGLTSAQDAAAYAKNPEFGSFSKYKALSEKLMADNPALADQFFSRAKMLREEGVNSALAMLDAGNAEGAMREFQSSGSMKLPEGSKFIGREGVDPLTRAKKTVYSAVGPNGETLVKDVHQAAYGYLLPTKDRATIEATLTRSDDSAEARRYATDMAFQRGLMMGGGGSRGSGGSGSGGAGGSKGAKDPGVEVLDDMFKLDAPGGGKHTGQQYGDAVSVYEKIPKVLPNGATLSDKDRAQISYDASVNQNSITTQINPETNRVERVYKMAPRPNAAGVMVPVAVPVAVWNVDQAIAAASTDDDAGKKARASLGAEVQKVTSKLPQNEQQNVIDSAFSDRARREYMGRYQGEIARSVQDLDRPQEWKDAYVKQNVDARERLIDLQREFGKKPEWVEKQESQARVKAGLAATANSNYTESQAASVKKWFGDEKPIIPSIANAAKGLYNSAAESFKQSNVRSEDYIRKTVADINKTGRIWPADASAIAATLKSKPELKSLFTPDQLEAIQARTGAQF